MGSKIKENTGFKLEKFSILNDYKTVGFVAVKKGKPLAKFNANISFLREVVSLLEKSPYEYVDICFYGEERPLLFGEEGVGVALAPRIAGETNRLKEKPQGDER